MVPEVALFLIDEPTLPVEDPVYIVTLAFIVFFVGPLVIERLGQPGIVGIVILGAILGPGGLGFLDETESLVLLGNAGLIYLLFTVGLQLDLRGFLEEPGNAAIFGLLSFSFPFVGGSTLAYLYLGLDLWAAVLLAAVFASHTLLAYPIVNKFRVTQNPAVTAVFGGILFTDTLALIVLAVVVGVVEDGFSLVLFADIGLSLLILFVGTWVVVGKTSQWFFQNFSEESYFEFLFVAVAFFAAASLAELLNIAPILGAFVAGIALNRLIPPGGTLMNRIEFVGNALFIPFFLLYVGILVDFGVIMEGVRTLEIAAVIIGVMIATKWLAAQAVGLIQGYTQTERNVMFGLSTGQAAAALAVTLIGFEVGLFTEEILNAVVLLLLVTALVSPWMTRRASHQLAMQREVGEGDGEPTDPRILVPVSHHAEYQRRLLELSFVLKDEESTEPVDVMTVVRPKESHDATEKEVAKAQESLEELVDIGHEADIDIEPETRINHNPAAGIVRGSYETQADMILVGWDAKRPLAQRMFGTVIDRVLDNTLVPVVIARLGHPVNTTERMFVVVPHGLDTHEGFFEGVHVVKRIADRVNAELEVVLVGAQQEQFERLFDLVEPEMTTTFTEVDSWRDLKPYLREAADDDDLTAALAPRQGRVGWRDEMRRLPNDLANLPPETFIVVNLREDDPEYDRRFLRYK